MTIRRFEIEPLLPLLAQGYTVLTPNNRSVDGILREYGNHLSQSGKQETGWQRPPVFAIDIYIQQLWQQAAAHGTSPFNETRLLNRFEETEIWLQIVKSSYAEFPLLNSEETADSVARSYQFFQQWEVSEAAGLERYKGAVDFQTFLTWSNQFDARCRKLNVVSLSDAGRLISANIKNILTLLPQMIALINFDHPPPLYSALFEAIGSAVDLHWSRSERGSVDLSNAYRDTASYSREFQTSRQEVAACLDWCNEIGDQNPEAHIGIIIDHNRSLESLVEQHFFNCSKQSSFAFSSYLNRYQSNEKLADLPHINAAMSLLSLNNELIECEGFCRTLQSTRIIGAMDERPARIALEIYLRKNFETEARLSHVREQMLHEGSDYHCPILAKAILEFDELARRESKQQSLRQWLQLFGTQLQTLGWPGTDSAERDLQLAEQWQQNIQRLAESSSVLGNISLPVALGKLQAFFKRVNVNLHFDDRLQISLIDIEEAQDLVFDHVWVLSVDDRNWPQTTKPMAFLPYSLQQELQLPGSSNQKQLDLAIEQLVSLRLNTSDKVVLSYHTLEEEIRIRRSPLLAEIEFAEEMSAESTPIKTAPNRRSLESFQDSLHIPLSSDERISGGTSLLSNQSNCPFRAFARNRLKATGLEEFSHGLSPLARGNALHKALEHLGTKLRDSETLHSLSATARDALISSSAMVATDFLRKRHPETMTPAFTVLEGKRLSGLLGEFLAVEDRRDAFVILHNEQEINWAHSKLSLTLRIDRIDRLEDGSILLIDYKTGRHANYRWFDERPDDMQLPIYQLAITSAGDDTVAATLIFQLNAENTGVISPMQLPNFGAQLTVSSQAKQFAGDWPALQEYWNAAIYGLAQEFEDGLLAIAPTRSHTTCQYCDLAPLCRIAETDRHATAYSEEEL